MSRGLNHIFHFRYCGTTKGLMLKCSLCSQNGLLSLVDRFLSGLECFASHPLLQKIFIIIIIISTVPAPKFCPDFFFFLLSFVFVILRFILHFVRGPVLSTADPTFYLSYLIFILSDIWSLLFLV